MSAIREISTRNRQGEKARFSGGQRHYHRAIQRAAADPAHTRNLSAEDRRRQMRQHKVLKTGTMVGGVSLAVFTAILILILQR